MTLNMIHPRKPLTLAAAYREKNGGEGCRLFFLQFYGFRREALAKVGEGGEGMNSTTDIRPTCDRYRIQPFH